MKITRTEHFGIQRKIVAHMTSESWREIPHVSYMYEADVTKLYSTFRQKRDTTAVKISFNTVILKLIVEGLKACPCMNSHISFNKRLVKGHICTYENIDISMPTILPDGKMMTLKLKNFGNLTLEEMSAYIIELLGKAQKTDINEALFSVSLENTLREIKNGHLLRGICRIVGAKTGSHPIRTLSGKEKREYEKISPRLRLTKEDLSQGTVTISNIGSLYPSMKGALSLLEIIPPQVCAFGVGAVSKRPVVTENDTIEARAILPVCIAFDHRAIDFADILPFIKAVDEILSSPQRLFDTDEKGTRRLSSSQSSTV